MKSLSLFDLAPDKVLLGRYRIVRPHRENGMSAAFRALDLQSEEDCELQAFPASLFEDPGQARSFADSLERWAGLEAEAVARVREVQVLEDGAAIVIADLPSGAPLRDVFAEGGKFTPSGVIALGSELLEGLETAHASGLIHGDIKPSTIFVGGEVPVLVDGGITPGLWEAKHLGSRTALIGTPYYAPIEQFGGDSPDERSDIYNLATVMYELLTGAMPWRGRSYIEVFQSKMQPEAPPMRSVAPDVEVDPELEAAIAKALRGKRMERHASAAEFRAALSGASVA